MTGRRSLSLCGIFGAVAVAFAGFAGSAFSEQVQQTGEEAYFNGDFATAARLWGEEAAAGSAEAKLGLGLLADRGLGMEQDTEQAFLWYLDAAKAGLADAQFNVAVMLDAGIGAGRNFQTALVWYTRAALREHRRAQYNLGLLYLAGDGPPANPDLSEYWFSQAAKVLPAAQTELLEARDDSLAEERSFTAPLPAIGLMSDAGDLQQAELVWTARPGLVGSQFLAEVIAVPQGGGAYAEPVISHLTEGSAYLTRMDARDGPLAWRVSRVLTDPTGPRYVSADWDYLYGGGPVPDMPINPVGRITFQIAPGDALADDLADEISVGMREAGLWVRKVEAGAPDPQAPAENTVVRYAFTNDEILARSIATFLPVLEDEDVTLDPALAAMPGEIVVRLVGAGLDPADDATQ